MNTSKKKALIVLAYTVFLGIASVICAVASGVSSDPRAANYFLLMQISFAWSFLAAWGLFLLESPSWWFRIVLGVVLVSPYVFFTVGIAVVAILGVTGALDLV